MKHVPSCSFIVQINGTIHIFELDFKNLPKSGDGAHFNEKPFHLESSK